MICRQVLGTEFSLTLRRGIVCAKCSGGRVENRISSGTIFVMQKLLSMDPRQIFRLKVSPEQRIELEKALENYLEYHLDRAVKAKKVLKGLIKI